MKQLLFVSAALSFTCVAAPAQQWPDRPVRIIAPAAPGGATDFTARVIAQKLTESIGQPVIVENRPGASGNIALEVAAKSTPDGYTLVMPISSFAMNPHLYKKLPFDTIKDFAPVALASVAPLYLVIPTSLPVKNVKELIALAKAKPGQLNFANSGNGTGAHLAGELFKNMAHIDLVSIAYKGGGPAVIDLVAGRVQMYFSTIPAALTQVQAGKLRGIAITTSKRVSMLPDVPTVAESGLPGYEIVGWYSIFAPAGTPKPIIAKLNQHIIGVLATPEMQQRFASEGLVPGSGSPEDLGKLLRSEITKWGALIKQIGLQPE